MSDSRRALLESLFHEHSHCVLDYARNRGMSFDEAEDVVSDTLLVCWRRLDEVPTNALPWLLVTARKTMANRCRSKRRREAPAERVANHIVNSPVEAVESIERLVMRTGVLKALAALDEDDREVLLLVGWDGLSGAEAARVLGCSRAAFAVRFRRAGSRLQRGIDGFRIPSCAGTEGLEGES